MKRWMPGIFLCMLLILCGVLGVLQYRWIGELAVLSRDRLRAALRVNLLQISFEFNSELVTAARSVVPTNVDDARSAGEELERRYEQARRSTHGARMFRRIGLAVPTEDGTALQILDESTGQLKAAEWPAEWEQVKRRTEMRRGGAPGPPGEPSGEMGSATFELPVFLGPDRPRFEGGFGLGRDRGERGERGRRRDLAWTVLELNLDYVRGTVLPEVVQRRVDLNEYEVLVVPRAKAGATIWESNAKAADIPAHADASIGLLEPRMAQALEMGRGRPGRGLGPPEARIGPESGRWILYVRHKAGSLDAVVARTRWRNLAVTAGVLLLLAATLGALFRLTRREQRLAQMQMDFVAGVSHELRTPLTAIYTAGHNLRGRVAHNPPQVERYGEMIQQESGRLRDLVEQVLRFSSINAGRVIQTPGPTAVERVIEDTVESTRRVMQAAHCTVEQHVDQNLPEILADPLALKHALGNLVSNAVKYGAKDDPWIGITASKADNGIEIRVADHGPGIPEEEQAHIFDAFYRGRRAVQDQIHGAGLGLNLAKKIVEAHGGSIRVESAPAKGAQFIVRLPAAPAGAAE